MTTTVTSFLLARIAEDERDAQNAQGSSKGRWRSRLWNGYDQVIDAYEVTEDCLICVFPDLDMPCDHVARWDPARVLAECEAKRRLVVIFSEQWSQGVKWSWNCLCLLALPYADHPDYQQEWAA